MNMLRDNRISTRWLYIIFFVCFWIHGVVSADPLQKGIQYYRNGDYRHAVQALEKAVTKHPYRADIYYLLGCSYQRAHQPDKAIKALKQARYLNSELKHLQYALGLSYFNSGRYVYAKLELEQALIRDPDNNGTRFFLWLTDMAINKNTQTGRYLPFFAEKYPGSPGKKHSRR